VRDRPKRSSRILVVALLLGFLAPGAFAADSEEERRRREPQTYESPLFSLLVLPVTVLLKMASVFEPEKSKGEPTREPRSSARD
jgi:hypothetical protein